MAYEPIKPVAEPGENVLLIDNAAYKLYQIAYKETLPPSHTFVVDASAGAGLAAGGNIPAFNTQNILDLVAGQLGQYRAYVLDDIHVTFSQPGQTNLHSTGPIAATINAYTKLQDPYDSLSEFFVLYNQRPFLRIVNPTGYALVQVRIAFYGYRFALVGENDTMGSDIKPIKTFNTIREARESSYKFAVVPIGGWPK